MKTSHIASDLPCVDNAQTFLTFKTQAITSIGSSFKFTVSPQFSFFFKALHDFILADFLKMPSVSSPFWLIKESISYREGKKRKLLDVSCLEAQSASLFQFWQICGIWGYSSRTAPKSIWNFFFSVSKYIFDPTIDLTFIHWNIVNTCVIRFSVSVNLLC